MKNYAKKRLLVRAVQWHGGEKTPELIELIGSRGLVNAETGQLELGNGWYVRPSDWVMSTSGEDFAVINDETFRLVYEEVESSERAAPTDATHELAGREFIAKLDALLVAGLRLSREEHKSLFRDRDHLVRALRHLLDDHAHVARQHELARIREKIQKDL